MPFMLYIADPFQERDRLPVFFDPLKILVRDRIQPCQIAVMLQVCQFNFAGNRIFRKIPDIFHIGNAIFMRQQFQYIL